MRCSCPLCFPSGVVLVLAVPASRFVSGAVVCLCLRRRALRGASVAAVVGFVLTRPCLTEQSDPAPRHLHQRLPPPIRHSIPRPVQVSARPLRNQPPSEPTSRTPTAHVWCL
eukprot:1600710-Rhodomonas_salina.2